MADNHPENDTQGASPLQKQPEASIELLPVAQPDPEDSSNEQTDPDFTEFERAEDFAISQDKEDGAQFPRTGLTGLSMSRDGETTDPGFTNPVFLRFGVNGSDLSGTVEENPAFCDSGQNPVQLSSPERDDPDGSCSRQNDSEFSSIEQKTSDHPNTEQNFPECSSAGQNYRQVSRSGHGNPGFAGAGRVNPGFSSGEWDDPAFVNPELYGPVGSIGGQRNPASSSGGRNGPGLGQPGEGVRRPVFVTRGTPAVTSGRRVRIIQGPNGGLIIRRAESDPRGDAPVLSRDIPVSDTERIISRTGSVIVTRRLAVPKARQVRRSPRCIVSMSLVVFSVMAISGGIIVGILRSSHWKSTNDDSGTQESYPPVAIDKPVKVTGAEFYAHFDMEEYWDESFSNNYSSSFRYMARRLQKLIDQIYSFSPLRNRFDRSNVIRMRKQSSNLIQVTSRLKLKDSIRTRDQSDLTAADLKVSFLKGHRSLLNSYSVGMSQKHFAVKVIPSSLAVTTTADTPTTTTTTTTTRRVPAWMTTKSPPAQRPYTTDKPPDVPCGEVRVLPDLRIVGGSEVQKGVYPWMVMLLKDTGSSRQTFFCGGSILDRWHILTAAHCLVLEPKNALTGMVNTQTHRITVVAGKHWSNTSTRYSQEQRVAAQTGYIHPAFTLTPIKNDIAVIRLSRPLQLTSRVAPLCPPASDDPLPPVCVVAGWGSLDHENEDLPKALRSATLRTYNSSECKRTFGSTFSYKGHSMDYYLDPGIMCASNATFGGQDTCQGDSGGPLFCLQTGASGERHYTQFGLVSWGVGCAEPGKPGFYTYLPRYISWVRSQALPRIDRYSSSRSDTDSVCGTFSPMSDFRVRQCRSQWRQLRYGSDCSKVTAVVSCMLKGLEQYNHHCQWQEVYNTVLNSLGRQQRRRCQAKPKEEPGAVCHNVTAISSALALCTQNTHCVSMLEVTLCVHSRLDPRWLQCTRQKLQEFISTHLNQSLHLCEDYTVRTMADGRQFMYMGGDWHVLCGDHWGHDEVKVACAQRGFRKGKPSFIHRTKELLYVTDRHNATADTQRAVKASDWLKVTCSGYESSLAECNLVHQTTCSSSYLAASVCYNTTYNFTLSTPQPGTHFGYVHLTLDEGEGHVCVPDLSDLAAHQLCREAGYVAGMVYRQSLAPPNSLAIWETEMQCDAGAVDVNGCAHGKWTHLQRPSGSCSLAKVFCFDTEARLHNGLLNSTGIVQMYRPAPNGHDVTLKTVCRHNFSDVNAGILCRQLGFSGASHSLSFNPFYKPNTRYVSVHCRGTERRLEDCEVRDGNRGVCMEPAAVRCGSQVQQEAELSVRLSGLDSSVQVWTGGQWGTVCTDHWTDNEAATICRQLGHLHGYRHFPPFEANARRDRPHVLHRVHCGENATSLGQCSYQPVTSDLCQHVPAAAVLCSNDSKPVYSLHSSYSIQPNEGNVHVTYNGTTALLRAYITNTTASALCQAMGYVTGQRTSLYAPSARGNVWVWRHSAYCADADKCVDAQLELINCTGSYGTRDYRCGHPGVSVYCYTSAARLHTGPRATTGIVQLYRKGQWWDVCHDDITKNAAEVICGDIMGSASAFAIILKDVYRLGTFPTVKATSYCHSVDLSMTSADCLVLDPTSKCESFNSDPASLVCYDGRRPSSGITGWKVDTLSYQKRVWVKRYGVWGTVCDDTWLNRESRLLCRHEGFSSGTYLTRTLKHDPDTPLWAWSVHCDIFTSSIGGCDVNLTSVVTGSCRTDHDAMVNCYHSSSSWGDNLYG